MNSITETTLKLTQFNGIQKIITEFYSWYSFWIEAQLKLGNYMMHKHEYQGWKHDW